MVAQVVAIFLLLLGRPFPQLQRPRPRGPVGRGGPGAGVRRSTTSALLAGRRAAAAGAEPGDGAKGPAGTGRSKRGVEYVRGYRSSTWSPAMIASRAVDDLGGRGRLAHRDHRQLPDDVPRGGDRRVHDPVDGEDVAGRHAVSEPRSMLTSWPSPAIMASSPMSTTYWSTLPVGGVRRVAGGRVHDERHADLLEGLEVVAGVDVHAGLLDDRGGAVLLDQDHPQPARRSRSWFRRFRPLAGCLTGIGGVLERCRRRPP